MNKPADYYTYFDNNGTPLSNPYLDETGNILAGKSADFFAFCSRQDAISYELMTDEEKKEHYGMSRNMRGKMASSIPQTS